MTIARLLLRSAQIWGDKTALIDAASGRTISFTEMVDASFCFGQKLLGGVVSTTRRQGWRS